VPHGEPPAPTPRFDANLAIVRAKVEKELDGAVAEVERRVTGILRGPWALVAPLARGFLHYTGHHEGRKHVLRAVDIHIAAAREVPQISMEEAIDRHLPEALAQDDFLTRIDWKHPRAPEAAALVTKAFRERVPPIVRLLQDGRGATYEDLVRSTHKRDEVERVLAFEFDTGRRLLAMAEADSALLRIPRAAQPPVLRLARDMLTWYEARASEEVRHIFEPEAPRAPPEG
jgi:hypothetical protein